MKRVNEAALDAIAQIIGELQNNPKKVITSNLGSGCHARPFGYKGDKSYKVVIPGDDFDMALCQLHYLLYDLGIDCGLSQAQLEALNNI